VTTVTEQLGRPCPLPELEHAILEAFRLVFGITLVDGTLSDAEARQEDLSEASFRRRLTAPAGPWFDTRDAPGLSSMGSVPPAPSRGRAAKGARRATPVHLRAPPRRRPRVSWRSVGHDRAAGRLAGRWRRQS